MKKLVSVVLCIIMAVSLSIPAFAQELDYKISNPYESVTDLLPVQENHYKTNLHTHSTLSDATLDYSDMIKGYYEQNFDILGFADHGVLGKYWNEKQNHLPIYFYQTIIGKRATNLTDEEYEAITGGTYEFSLNREVSLHNHESYLLLLFLLHR